MVNPVLVAAPVAIVPAALIIWWLLNRYEEFFDDSRVFLSLTFGFFAGLFAIFLELALFPFLDPEFQVQVGPGTAFMMFVVGYAFFEAGIKTAVLGMKRFSSRRDSPYYGAAFGVGMGAMMALGFIALNLNGAQIIHQLASQNATANATVPPTSYHPVPFIGMVLVPVGALLVHAAAGAVIASNIIQGRLWKGWLIGAGMQAPVLLAMALFWPSIGRTTEPQLVPGLFALIVGLVSLTVVRRTVLDHVVPAEVKDALRRAKRREARQASKADEDKSDEPDER